MPGTRRSISIGGPAAASLLVNALMIAALLNLGLGHAVRHDESPALTVMSLALLKGTEEGKDTPEAEAAASAPEMASAADATPPTPRLAPAPAPALVPVLSAISQPMPVIAATSSGNAAERPASSAPAETAAPISPPAASARRGAEDGLDVQAPQGTSRSYAAKVRSWLYAHKIYPRRARMRREEGRVRVRFVIDRTGTLIEGGIVEGSGNRTLDEEAAAMLYRASPYPRPPKEVGGERIEFLAPIEFTLPV